ncbi:MAG: hypothetical protein GWP06_01935 [Actinobacteria bacterium]|nr:hypothetical protein [Actinomycetota bacterium]
MKYKARWMCSIAIMAVLLMLEAGEAKIWVMGRVVNGTESDQAVLNQAVQLYANGNTSKPILRSKTDATGKYRLQLADSLLNGSFYVATNFQKSDYYSESFQLQKKHTSVKDLIVYESTNNDSHISVGMEHIVITPDAGVLQIKDIYFVQNTGKTTFVGTEQVATDKFSTFSIPIPPASENIDVGGDLMSCCAILKNSRIHETMPIKPGTRQEVITYVYPYKGREVTLEKPIIYSTAVIDILIPYNTALIQVANLVDMGALDIKGVKYSHYKLENLPARMNAQIRLSGLPGKPKSLVWLVVLAALATIIGFFAYALLRRRKVTLLKDDTYVDMPPTKAKEMLLQRIVALDDIRDNGKISEEAYQTERERLKQSILQL